MTQQIFITGASGCIGHYVVETLLTDYPNAQLHLLSRDPKRFKFNTSLPQITLHQGSMGEIEALKDVLSDMTHIIHIATEWGAYDETIRINVDKTLEMLSYLSPKQVERILYFSTASILGTNNQPTQAALRDGTHYVKSKAMAYEKLKTHPLASKITTLFPTTVFGGDDTHPYSHLSEGIPQNTRYLNILRWFYFDASFHFMHGKDIAAITSALINSPTHPSKVVLGYPVITEREAVRQLCKLYKVRVYFQLNIPTWFVFLLTKIFRIQLSAWDRYCIANPNFSYQVHNPSHFGRKTAFPTLSSVLSH